MLISSYFYGYYRYDHVKPKPSPSGKALYTTPRETVKTRIVQTTNDNTSSMVSLKEMLRGGSSIRNSPSIQKSPEEWVKATEFIPGQPYQCASSRFCRPFNTQSKVLLTPRKKDFDKNMVNKGKNTVFLPINASGAMQNINREPLFCAQFAKRKVSLILFRWVLEIVKTKHKSKLKIIIFSKFFKYCYFNNNSRLS